MCEFVPITKSMVKMLWVNFAYIHDLKICNLKWEQRSKVNKVCKQVRDQIVWKQVKDTAQALL